MTYELWIEYKDDDAGHIEFRRFEKEWLNEVLEILRSWIYNCDGFHEAWAFADVQSGERIYLDFYDLTEIMQRMQEGSDQSSEVNGGGRP